MGSSGIRQGMWGLTCYFNPLGWKSRRRIFETFQRSLRIPLFVVEWSPSGQFEIEPGNGLKVLQISGGSILWQKERLLNIGIKALPEGCTHVTLMDADLIFEDADWHEQAVSALKTHRLVQPFSEVCHLPSTIDSGEFIGVSEEPAYTSRCISLGKAMSVGAGEKEILDQIISNQCLRFKALLQQGESGERYSMCEDVNAFRELSIPTPGLALSCHRETLDQLGGMPDRFIGGGGDLFLLFGLLGRGHDLAAGCCRAGLTYVNHFAYRKFCDSQIQRGQSLGFLRQRVFHLHHGSLSNRHYDGRHVALQRMRIDLDKHLGLSSSGLLRFRGPSKEPLERHMNHYFMERMDDDEQAAIKDSAGQRL
ncbi:hypothetical protein [Synechococcus sp. 1G10]|uniref:hypothetical protein n=1 Tax=Synechococcus sp. 1G10 TaxID=2025605 RepID=UPI0011813493|nr:hypothetical protein [Synechococcus sp. 1G10]